MGVGGDDSWTASVHEDFLIQPQFYEMIYSFEIIKGKDHVDDNDNDIKDQIDDNDNDLMSISENVI
jgi:hypothetical protein